MLVLGSDKQKAAVWIRENALPPFGRGKCAKHVRLALEAGGINTSGHPVDAKDWGATLTARGFREVGSKGYSPLVGDVVVIQSTSQSASGHIQIYDGSNWISDFIQTAFWPGPSFRVEKPNFKIYRSC